MAKILTEIVLLVKHFSIPHLPDGWISVPQVDDSPHVGAEPHGGPRVRLVLSDKYRVRDGQEPHQGAVLKEPTRDYSQFTLTINHLTI